MGILLTDEELWAIDKTIPDNFTADDTWYSEYFYLKAQALKVLDEMEKMNDAMDKSVIILPRSKLAEIRKKLEGK